MRRRGRGCRCRFFMSAVIFWSEHVFTIHALHENLIEIPGRKERRRMEINSKDKYKSDNKGTIPPCSKLYFMPKLYVKRFSTFHWSCWSLSFPKNIA